MPGRKIVADQKRWINIFGAREHNLDNLDVQLPREELTVVTGLSGSGKSSLAFDTLYAEGQRRFVESLSAYARRFLGQLEKPDVERIDGLTPTIAIQQKNHSHNPRSTVGTVTEIYDYMRLLYARVGEVYCPRCSHQIEATTIDRMVEEVFEREEGTRLLIIAPVVRGRKGEYRQEMEELQREGFPRVRVDGETFRLDHDGIPELEKEENHTIEAVIDRVKLKKTEDMKSRLTDSMELAGNLAEGLVKIEDHDSGESQTMSEQFACPECGYSYSEVEPRIFSFNSPYGACEACDGLGHDQRVDPDLIFDERLSLADGALKPFSSSSSTWFQQQIRSLADRYDIDLQTPIEDLTEEQRNILLYGTEEELEFSFSSRAGAYSFEGKFKGAVPLVWKRYKRSSGRRTRRAMENYMSREPCPECGGRRLQDSSLSILIEGKNIAECCEMHLDELREFIKSLEFSGMGEKISRPIVREIEERLSFLEKVGLQYLTLSREASSLSGGEAQRIRLATQIGSRLAGVTYVLDEPTIGLHSRDNARLLETLEDLRDLDNTVVVVEHDEQTIRSSDYVIDLGPEAGQHGGEIMYQGGQEELTGADESLTAAYLRGDKQVPLPDERRQPAGYLTVNGARGHNLKDIDVDIPISTFTCVTGVSGSGKSSLIYETLYRQLKRHFYSSTERPLDFNGLDGLDEIDKVVNVDQSPIGRTPRSNTATYTGVFTPIRELFADLPEAKMRGYDKGRFSFNVKGGRCENCGGAGREQIEMHFLPDVYVTCDECDGKRYNSETLEVRYRGKSIADVLDMPVAEALEFFEKIPKIRRRLKTLNDVGLGYVKLGQPATTLSGGEAQRVKLASELSRVQTGDTIYLLDEPTTGLHKEDIRKLLHVLHRLVDNGNTVVVIEHNMEIIKNSDWIIDLGPEGGEKGGEIVYSGPTPAIVDCEESYTADYLED
ncbi:MAG: excinuclease ABC subunit UvrA, partial [bacterium]